jgi:hypothetical protein
MRNDQRQRAMEIRGQQIPIIPSQWQDDELTMTVAVALTPQEGTDVAQKLLTMHSILSQDEQMGMVYGLKQKHALMDAVFDAMGIADSTPYLGVPDSPEVVQQMQAQQEQMMQAQQKQEQMEQFQMSVIDDNNAREWQKLNNTIMDTMTDNTLNEEKFEWQQVVETNEMEIERQQGRAASIG